MKNLWISLPVSLICLFAQAQAPTTTTTTASTPAPTAAKAPAKAAAPGAATTSAVNTVVAQAPKAAEPAKSVSYGLTLGAEYGFQAAQQPDGSRSQSLTYNFMGSLSYGDYTLKNDNYFTQDLNDSSANQGNQWTDPAFILSKKAISLGEYFKFSPSGTLWLPIKDSSRNEVGMLYTVMAAGGISLNTKALNMDAWSFGYNLAVYRSFTQFDTNAKTGAPSQHSKIRNRFTFGYQIMDKLSFFNLFDFNSNYSVNGVVTNSFFTLQTIGYDITDSLNLSISHTNGGSYLKSKTYESNLKIYNEESSEYAIGLSMSI